MQDKQNKLFEKLIEKLWKFTVSTVISVADVFQDFTMWHILY